MQTAEPTGWWNFEMEHKFLLFLQLPSTAQRAHTHLQNQRPPSHRDKDDGDGAGGQQLGDPRSDHGHTVPLPCHRTQAGTSVSSTAKGEPHPFVLISPCSQNGSTEQHPELFVPLPNALSLLYMDTPGSPRPLLPAGQLPSAPFQPGI